MPSTALLPYLHIFTPILLSLPLLSLFPPARSGPIEIPGIRPITVRKVTPRRGFILTILILLAITSFLDGVVLIASFFGARSHQSPEDFENPLILTSWVLYTLGGLIVWSLTTIVVEWRAKWGDKGVVSAATLGLVCEIPNLVFLIIRTTQASGGWKLFTVLSIPPSGLRLLLLPVLLAVVSNPKISYVPADETSGLLGSTDEDDNGESSTPVGRETYGTFENGSQATKSRAPSASPSTAAPPTGANTPAVNKGPIKIPKKLGEIKTEDKPMQWREVLKRVRKLSPYLWPSTSRRLQLNVVCCVVLLLAGRVLQPLLPLSLGGVVRALTNNQGSGSVTKVWPPFLTYFIIRIVVSGSGVLYFVQQRLWIPISQYTDREMMMLCFNHLLNLSLAYHTKRNTGEVLKVIDRGSAMNNLFQTILFTAAPTVIDITVAFGIFLWLYGGLLATVTFLVMGVYLWVSVWATQRRVATRRLLMERDVKQRGIISDVLTNWESVKYFTAEQRETVRFREAILSYQETESKWNIDYQLLYLLQSSLLSVGLLAGSLLISYRVLKGTADAAEFVVYIQYFQQLASPLDRLGYLYSSLNRNSIDAEKMFALLAEATEVNDKPDAKDLVITDGIVEFDNVRFSYDGQVQALKGVSFKIGKGESMALVGESGSGKSTILRLLYRFYDIDSGVIRIDGQDISQVTQLSLRRAIGIVPQDSVLWNDTIGANIAYGKEGADEEEIVAAAKAAKMHERILSFADEYATIVGERGVRLSGGEKQRVSLARMFLKSPAILVLDEATSALDTETEREIQRALAELAKGRSSLSIAHRLSTIINSDRIVVMKDGEVVENGSYAELLDRDGAFATMWKNQIFTEAERVSKAQDAGEGTPLLLLDEELKVNNETMDDTVEEGSPTDDTQDDSKPRGGGDEAVLEEQSKVPNALDADTEHQGFTVESEPTEASLKQREEQPSAPSTYAEAVKVPPTEAIQTIPGQPSKQVDEAETKGSTETATVPEPAQSSASAANSTPDKKGKAPEPSAGEHDTPGAATTSTTTGTSTPEKRVSFPPMPRMSTSQSTASHLSEFDSAGSSGNTPNASVGDLREAAQGSEEKGEKGDKRRKRLSSIKGFVRRISDQGISRSPSMGGGSSKKSPMGEVDEATALLNAGTGQGEGQSGSGQTEKRKKRLSLKGKN